MCLISKEFTPTIAQEDLIVYKLLKNIEGQLSSPHRLFEYELNKLYQTELGIENGTFEPLTLQPIKVTLVREGFHGYWLQTKHLEYSADALKCEIYECIIPKGSEIYYGMIAKDIVSNQLIINKLCV